MNLEDCLNYVGLPVTDAKVKQLLADLGCTKEPKCKKSEPDYDFVSQKYKVELLFKDEDYLKSNTENCVYGLAPLVLQAINLPMQGYSGGYPNNFVQLPNGINVGMSRDEVLSKMIKPSKTIEANGKVRNDQWLYNAGRIYIAYNPELIIKNITIVTTNYDWFLSDLFLTKNMRFY